jgi:hypothetical protein
VGNPVRKSGRENVLHELGEGLAPCPAPPGHQTVTRPPITLGVRGERPGDEHGRRLDRQATPGRQITMEPEMAMVQVLAHFVPYVAQGPQPARNPGPVIGFHLLSMTPGADIDPKAGCAARR